MGFFDAIMEMLAGAAASSGNSALRNNRQYKGTEKYEQYRDNVRNLEEMRDSFREKRESENND